MALVRKTRFCSNLGKAEFPIANHFDRPSQPQMNDIAMRAHSDGAGEGAGNWLRLVIFASVATSSGWSRCSNTKSFSRLRMSVVNRPFVLPWSPVA